MCMGAKRILMLLAMVTALSITLSGCQKKANIHQCKNDSDCHVDASGKEINGVCYMGKCEECAQSSDCSDLKQCVNNRCVASCHADADCGESGHCENSYCVANCTSDSGCPDGHVCAQGQCIAQIGDADPNGWAKGDCQGLGRIYFDFDRYEVKKTHYDDAKHLAKCLEENPGYTVTIEGHTDERGTTSYNMVLGQRRADAVSNFLKTNWGIASHRIRTLSHGAQKPAVLGESTEYAWQQNRRAEFVLATN
jgi:peptidoglycan-associated lipoprotein